jgi:hypothetical protein
MSPLSPRHGARLAALLVPACLALPTAAHAEKVVTEDAVGDVLSLSQSEDLADAVPAPDYAGVDVVRTAVAHGAQRLRVSVRFRSLERDPFQFTIMHVSTPQGGYDIQVERLRDKPVTSLARGRNDVDCRGLKTKVDLVAETVTTSLPTSCLGAPRWVKVGVGAVALAADQASPELAAAYADDAHRDGEIRDRIAPGPKVHRG